MGEATKYHRRIKLAAIDRKNEYEKNWNRFKLYYSKGRMGGSLTDEDKIKVEIVYSIIRSLEAGLYYHNPYIYLESRSQRFVNETQAVEKLLNNEWRDSHIDREIKRKIRDNLVVGHSWSKTGYMGMSKSRMLQTGQLHQSLRPNKLYTLRVSPWDMFKNREASVNNIWWASQRYYRKISELENDKRFPKNLDIDAKDMMNINSKNGENILKGEVDNEDFLRVEMFDFWDRQKEEYLIIASGTDKVLYKSKFPPYGFAFDYLCLEEDIDSFYGLSSVEKVESEAREINETRTQRINHRKRMKAVIMYDPKLINAGEMERIRNSSDMSLIPVKNLASRISGREGQAWAVLETPSIPADLYNTETICKQSIRETMAVPAYSQAQREPGIKTAYEASQIKGGEMARNTDRMKIINRFLAEVAKKHIDVIKSKYSDRLEIPFFDEKGKQAFRHIKGTDIKGFFNVNINVAESIPEDDMVRIQREERFFELFANHPNFDDVILAKDVFDAHNKKNFDKVYKGDTAHAGAPGTPDGDYGLSNRNKEGQKAGMGASPEVEPSRVARAKTGGAAGGGRQ